MKISFTATLVALLAIASFSEAGKQKPLERAGICKKDGFLAEDGTQHKNPGDHVCVSTPMGELPDIDHMVSTLIVSPANGQVIQTNKPFNVTIAVKNLKTGFFSDPNAEYYIASQTLSGGIIKGHSHVTIQKLDGGVPDPKVFAFFKGLNDPAVKGLLTVAVDKGLPAGKYRICTMASSETHQPVLMPVAQRGSQDDCIRMAVAGRPFKGHGKEEEQGKKEVKGKKEEKKGNPHKHNKRYLY